MIAGRVWPTTGGTLESSLFFILAEELELDIVGLGQLTCRREEFRAWVKQHASKK